jgi:hypothetical protein
MRHYLPTTHCRKTAGIAAARDGGGGRTRTSDTGLMRPLLCHLSYAADQRAEQKIYKLAVRESSERSCCCRCCGCCPRSHSAALLARDTPQQDLVEDPRRQRIPLPPRLDRGQLRFLPLRAPHPRARDVDALAPEGQLRGWPSCTSDDVCAPPDAGASASAANTSCSAITPDRAPSPTGSRARRGHPRHQRGHRRGQLCVRSISPLRSQPLLCFLLHGGSFGFRPCGPVGLG